MFGGKILNVSPLHLGISLTLLISSQHSPNVLNQCNRQEKSTENDAYYIEQESPPEDLSVYRGKSKRT